MSTRVFFHTLCILALLCSAVCAQDQGGDKTPARPDPAELKTAGFEIEHSDYYMILTETTDAGKVTVHGLIGQVRISVGGYRVKCERLVLWERKVADEAGGTRSAFEFYAEESVRLTYDGEYAEADALYIDVEQDLGSVVKGKMRVFEDTLGTYLYARGDKLRAWNLSDQETVKLKGENILVSTCHFKTPDWSLRIKELEYDAALPQDQRITARGLTLNIWNLPISYVPRLRQFEGAAGRERLLRSVRLGSSSEFGQYAQTTWGKRINEWIDAELELDYYTKRGFATGLDVTYARPGEFFGLLDTYWIPKDKGEDFKNTPLLETNRGRAKWQHRHYLPHGWRVDAEVSYLSDRHFLDEYFEKENREDKAQETDLYLRKLWENYGFTVLYQPRINDFTTQTEYLPRVALNLYSQKLWATPLYFDSENQVGHLQRRFDEDVEGAGIFTWRANRAHSRNRVTLPFNFDEKLFFSPYLEGQFTAYDDIPTGGDAWNLSTAAGLRVNHQMWKKYDYDSKLLDAEDLRHIISTELRLHYLFHSELDPWEVFQFDDIDDQNEHTFVKLSQRHRLQTKRQLAPEDTGKSTVTLLDLDLELTYYLDQDRIARAPLNGDFESAKFEYKLLFRPREAITVTSSMDYNIRRGRIDTWDGYISYKASDRVEWSLGHRYAHEDISSTRFGIQYNWSKKWNTGYYINYDFEQKGIVKQELMFRRSFHDFLFGLGFEYDNGRDNFGVLFTFSSPIGGMPDSDFFARYAFDDWRDPHRP